MSERPTPETDAVAEAVGMGHFMVDADFARRLERERDEARAQIKELIYIADRAIALAEKDFWFSFTGRLIGLENDKFGVVSELRGDLEKIKEVLK